MGHGRKLDVGGDLHHIMVGLRLWLGGALPYTAAEDICYPALVQK